MNSKYNSGMTVYDVVGGFNYNVRNIMELYEKVDGAILEKAANEAMHRYPYMKKRVVQRGGEYVYIDNDLPIVVYERQDETLPLGSRDVNYHLVSIDYQGNCIGFNLNHTICGGCGILPWIKTTLYCYFRLKYGRELEVPNLNRPEDLPEEGERDMPLAEKLPEAEPVGVSRVTDDAFVDYSQYTGFFGRADGKQYYYIMEIPVQEFMHFSHLHDGSPASLLSSFMYRTCLSLYPDNQKPIQGMIVQNYRAAVGCPRSTCDLVRSLYVPYPENAKDWTIDRLNTFNRGCVIIQSEDSNGILEARGTLARYDSIDACETIQDKIEYCQKHLPLSAKHPATYYVSYAGRIDWGDILQYLRAKHTLVDGCMTLEVASVGSNFDVVLEQLDDSDQVIRALTAEFDREGIGYILRGPFPKNAAPIRLDQD